MSLLLGLATPVGAQQIANDAVTVRAVHRGGGLAGFDLLSHGTNAATVRFSSAPVHLLAHRCEVQADSLVFTGLQAPSDTGLELGERSSIAVRLNAGAPYPVISFDLEITGFDPAKWKAAVGREPFHFLALYLRQATAWHQRGWLNATPLADPFPLLLDRHAGTPEISAYHYNRDWSYTPPLGADPLPVIGLWAPRVSRYVGLEFQTTRLQDNSERDIATGYCWVPARGHALGNQFVALVYPFGGQGYQQLEFPKPGTELKSHGTLLWSLNLPATGDPNRFLWSFLWPRIRHRLPRPPAVADVSWIPGGIDLRDFQGPPPGGLIGGAEKPFQADGTRLISGWTWHNESAADVAARHGNTNRLKALEHQARELLRFAKRFTVDGEPCVYWEKPLTGQWTDEWGGKPVTTLHNANGFAAGRLFLDLYRDLGRKEYLPIIDGVLNWAKHISWTRNEFSDVPSSPFAIGGTLSASFCLDYYMTFKDSSDQLHRDRAKTALQLARSFTFRYMVMWPCDNNRYDNLDSSFLWEPNSGRDWTGAACANEVFWNLDTLAQTAVHTGDPILLWALEGSLSHWHLLYQDVVKPSLADYQPSDMDEGYGLYAGNIYGVGKRSTYGFASPLVMTEPVGHSLLRVLAGEKAALAFRKTASPMGIADYHYSGTGNLAFTVLADKRQFDVSLTVPYVDLSEKPVSILRDGHRLQLQPGRDFIRPAQALWSLYLKNIKPNDHIIIGEPDETGPSLPCTPPHAEAVFSAARASTQSHTARIDGYTTIPLPFNATPAMSWSDANGWAGVPRGRFWAFGVPFSLAPISGRAIVTHAVQLAEPIRDANFIYLLYSYGTGAPPSLVYAGPRARASSQPLEALAWRAWPPLFTGKLLLTRIPLKPGEEVVGLNPGSRAVWALTTFKFPPGRHQLDPATRAALADGAAEWKRLRHEESEIQALRAAVNSVPRGTIAILPPKPGGEPWSIIQRIGLAARATFWLPPSLSIRKSSIPTACPSPSISTVRTTFTPCKNPAMPPTPSSATSMTAARWCCSPPVPGPCSTQPAPASIVPNRSPCAWACHCSRPLKVRLPTRFWSKWS